MISGEEGTWIRAVYKVKDLRCISSAAHILAFYMLPSSTAHVLFTDIHWKNPGKVQPRFAHGMANSLRSRTSLCPRYYRFNHGKG